MKKCSKCGVLKPLDEYQRHPQSRDGRRPDCKACYKAQHQLYTSRPEVKKRIAEYMANYEYNPTQEQRDKWAVSVAERNSKSPRHALSVSRKNALTRRPTENPISIDQLMRLWEENDGRCALSRIKMTWRQKTIMPTSISLDRIDPSKGYVAGNVRLICFSVNAFRNVMEDGDMLTMAKAIVATMESTCDPTWQSFPAFTNESDFMVIH
jgi:hypothetical protein